MLLAALLLHAQVGTVQETICLPIRSLPGQDKRSCQDGIRRLSGEGTNGLVKATESDATVLEGQAADKRAVGEEGDVHGRKGEQGVHHIGRRGTNVQETGQPG